MVQVISLDLNNNLLYNSLKKMKNRKRNHDFDMKNAERERNNKLENVTLNVNYVQFAFK